MKHWQSLTISIMAHAALLSIPLTAAMQLQNRPQALRFIVIGGESAAGGQPRGEARNVPVRKVLVPSAAERKPAGAAEATVPHMQRSRSEVHPRRSTPPKQRASRKRSEKIQHHSPTLAVPSTAARRRVHRQRDNRNAPAPVAASHVKAKPADQTKPSRTVAMTRTQAAGSSSARAGGAAPEAASAARPGGGGPIAARWGAANGPRFLHRVMPEYPRLARRLGREGTVLLRVTIDKHGHPIEVKIVKGAGYGFDDQARMAVRESLFVPAREAGRAVCCKVLLPVRFVLRSSP